MRNIDKDVMLAKKDERYLEDFIGNYESFILHAAHKVTGKYISKRDDQWSVALLAFHEAIKSYNFDKGAFLPFAETVIRRRLYDDFRKQSRLDCEVPIDSYTIENDMENDMENDIQPIKYEVMNKIAVRQEVDAKLEILTISEILSKYGISFRELAVSSPKAGKTRSVCGQAVMYLVQNPILLTEMRKTKTLPLKILEKNKNLPRKVLERHRKYIIAGTEIISGEYPILSEYLKFIKEESLI